MPRMSMDASHAESYENAQCLEWRGTIQRERLISRPSMEAPCVLRGLCISIAVYYTVPKPTERRWQHSALSMDASHDADSYKNAQGLRL